MNETLAVKEYDAKVDSKKRVTLRGASYDFYHVSVLGNGRIILDPRELMPPFKVSANTLEMMDAAVENLRKGVVSETIDLSEFGG